MESFSRQRYLMVFHWNLNDNESSQVARTLLSILDDLSNPVVGIVSTRCLISKSSSPFTNPFVIVPRAPITIDIAVTFVIHNIFNSLARCRFLFFLLLSCHFTLWSARTAMSKIPEVVFFFYYYNVWSLAWDKVIRLYVKIPEEVVRLIIQDRF